MSPSAFVVCVAALSFATAIAHAKGEDVAFSVMPLWSNNMVVQVSRASQLSQGECNKSWCSAGVCLPAPRSAFAATPCNSLLHPVIPMPWPTLQFSLCSASAMPPVSFWFPSLPSSCFERCKLELSHHALMHHPCHQSVVWWPRCTACTCPCP
jgi:hypothetical protein